MLSLVVTDASGVDRQMETFATEPVSLNLRFLDLTDIGKSVGSFSQAIRLPLTDHNRLLFEGAQLMEPTHDADGAINQGRLNLRKRMRCEIRYEGAVLMRGQIQAKQVVHSAMGKPEVECVVFGDTSDLSVRLASLPLRDLPWDELDITWNEYNTYRLNTYSTYSIQLANDLPNALRCAPVDKGQGWSFNSATANPAYAPPTGRPIYPSDFLPYVQLAWVVDKIAETLGFKWDRMPISSELYLALPGFGQGMAGGDQGNRLYVGRVSNQTYTWSTSAPGGTYITWQDGQAGLPGNGEFFDLDNAYAGNTYNAPLDGAYTIDFQVMLTHTPELAMTISVYKNGSLLEQLASWNGNGFYNSAQISKSMYEKRTYTLAQNDQIQVRFDGLPTASGTHGITILGLFSSNSGWYRSKMRVLKIQRFENFPSDIAAMVPDRSALELMQGLQKAWNLVFEVQENDVVYMNHLVSSLQQGQREDWSDRVDRSKDVVVRTTADLQAQEYLFALSEAPDAANQAIQEALGRTWGQYRLLDEDNDFATGTSEVRSSLHPYLPSNVDGGSLPLWRMTDLDGNPVQDPGLYLAYYNSTVSTTNYFYSSSADRELVGVFSPFRQWEGGANQELLGFYPEGLPTESDYPVQGYPQDTFWQLYWEDWVRTLYSAEARVMECSLLLTAADVSQLKRYNQYHIDGHDYRLLELKGYTPGATGVARAVFLLDLTLDAQAVAGVLRVTEAPDNGVLTFTDADGTTGLTGNRQACIRAGGIWDGTQCTVATQELRPQRRVHASNITRYMGRDLGNEVGPNNVVTGGGHEARGTSNLLVGSGHTLHKEATGSAAVGKYHQVKASDQSMLAAGHGALAFGNGFHLGGAFAQPQGTTQCGTWIWHGSGTIAKGASDTSLPLLLGGQKGKHLQLPNDAIVHVRFHLVAYTKTGTTIRQGGATWDAVLTCYNSTAAVLPSSQPMTPGGSNVTGSYSSGQMSLEVDTTTDTTQHQLRADVSYTGTARFVLFGHYVMTLEP